MTAEELGQIFRQLRAEKRDKAEKRKEGRVGVRAKIRLVPHVEGVPGKPIDVWTRDLSQGGMSVLHSQSVPQDTCFCWELVQESGGTERVYARVRFCKRMTPQLYSLGLQFCEKPAVAAPPPARSSLPPDAQPQDAERIRRAILD